MEILDSLNPNINRKAIKLNSRKGNDISNYQEFNLDKNIALEQMNSLKRKYPSIIIRPNTITGIYNCHGLTLASRRTGINSIDENLLREDDFCRIDRNELLEGDIVVYLDGKGEMEHSGIVIAIQNIETALFGSVIKVLSKWGDGSEVIHDLFSCEYDKSNIVFFRCKS